MNLAIKHFDTFKHQSPKAASELLARFNDATVEENTQELMVIGFRDGSKLSYTPGNGWKVFK